MNLFLETIGWTLLHSTWEFLVIGIVLWLIASLCFTTARTRYLVWCSGLILVVVAPMLTFALLPQTGKVQVGESRAISDTIPGNGSDTRKPGPDTAPRTNANNSVADTDAKSVIAAKELENDVTAGTNSNPSSNQISSEIRWFSRMSELIEPYLPALVLTWILGASLFSLRVMLSMSSVRRFRRRGCSPANEETTAMVRRLCKQMSLSRTVQVVESTLIRVPSVVGFFQPLILLPASVVSGLPTNQLQAILAHELAHVRRHDYLINFIQRVVEALFFYHPMVWWISRRIREERENSCDDTALECIGNRLDLAKALLKLEEFKDQPATVVAANGGSLLTRIKRLAGNESKPAPSWQSGLFMLLILAGMLSFSLLVGTLPKTEAQSPIVYERETAIADDEVPGESKVKSASSALRKQDDETDKLDFHGIDLNRFPNTEVYDAPKQTCFIPLDGEFSIYYEYQLNQFRVRRDLTRKSDRQVAPEVYKRVYYGPIPGNPVEKLELKSYLLNASKEFSSNARLAMAYMMRTDNKQLIETSLDLMAEMLLLEEIQDAIKNRGRHKFQGEMNLEFAIEAYDRNQERLKKLDVAGLEKLQAAIEKTETAFAAAMPEIDNKRYNEAGYLQNDLPADDEIEWSNVNDGMRIGVMRKTPVLLASNLDPQSCILYLQNRSNKRVYLHLEGHFAEWVRVHVRDSKDQNLQVEIADTMISSIAFPLGWQLEPGEKLRLCEIKLSAVGPDAKAKNSGLRGWKTAAWRIRANPGKYSCQFEVPINTRRGVRSRGEWFGTLNSVEFEVNVGD